VENLKEKERERTKRETQKMRGEKYQKTLNSQTKTDTGIFFQYFYLVDRNTPINW
jgi:hypothetical protein